ncbi:hypothetical protein [Cellulomonas sp. C5510]|uniref:hypothetical protein n=1 Tax=Cellulomonas sp. C5510 TaxID=2871170 RepID=UPI002107B11B|nr:hypothetical protein [Cellulomonas sp. C5510]
MVVRQLEPDGVDRVLAAPAERVWRLRADPRQLERWWGPPSRPAAFTEHELVPGGRAGGRPAGRGLTGRGWAEGPGGSWDDRVDHGPVDVTPVGTRPSRSPGGASW